MSMGSSDDATRPLPPLPPRLLAVAGCVLRGRPVADVGTDHALLPIYLVRAGLVPRVVATDRAWAPFDGARRKVELWSEGERIVVRRGDGLAPLLPEDEVATIVLAGLGGKRIARILSPAALARVPSVERVVLQANTDMPFLRAFMKDSGWRQVERIEGPEQRWPWTVEAFAPGG